MKKIVLLFFFSFLFLNSKAQTSVYHPFPDSNAVWNVRHFPGLISCSPIQLNESYSYIFTGDTVIKSQTYHKLSVPFVQTTDTCTWWHTLAGYKGCLRQDTALKKVFYVLPGDSSEHILYDFNLQPGDTLPDAPPLFCSHYSRDTIQSIDSVLIGSGYRKRWNRSAPFFSRESIIEGIGSTSGLLEFCGFIPDWDHWTLGCFSQDEAVLYHPDTAISCNIIASVNNLSSPNNAVSIYPNPLTTSSTLQLNPQLKDAEVIIYDMLGHEMMRKKMNGDKMEIERGNLMNGVYFVKVQSDEKQFVQKIIVE